MNTRPAYEADKARKASYGRDCVDCGKRTDGSNGRAKAPERCRACSDAHRKVWTREAIIAAMHLFAHRHGRQPGARDWNPAVARADGRPDIAERFYADGDYPMVNTVVVEYGSWNEGIRAAGFEPQCVGKKFADRAKGIA